MDLEQYTKDELNDMCAREYPDLNIKTSWSRKKIISTISKFIESLNKSKEEIAIEEYVENKNAVKCHRCRHEMVLIDKINNDYKCFNCGAHTTVMRVF